MDNPQTAQFIGKLRWDFEDLPSTNTFAIDLLSKQNPSEGTIIVARNQTNGRGQLSKSWESEPGQNITFSCILYPGFLSAQQHIHLNQTIALGVRDFISTYVKKNVKIKWPNDIMVGDKKIAGILMQNSLHGDSIQHCVAGIGININQTSFQTAERPTSFALESDQTFDVELLLRKLCYFLESRYLQLRQKEFEQISANYHQHLFRLHEWQSYIRIADGSAFSGRLEGINTEGKLMLLTEGGMSIYNLHEIRFF